MMLTLYAGAKNPVPWAIHDNPWEEVVACLREILTLPPPTPILREDGTRDLESEKVQLPAFAPHRLTKPHRNASNVAAVTHLVLDLDRCDADALATRIETLGIAAFVYASPSDNADSAERRIRIVAPITREIAPAECADTRFRFAELLGIEPGQGVEGASDAARLFFIGGLEGTQAREHRVFEGAPIDVDTLPALQRAWKGVTPKPSVAPPAPSEHERHPTIEAALAAIRGALGPWQNYQGSKWHLCGALGGLMRKAQCYSEADCAALIRAWLPSNEPSVNVENGVAWACGAWNTSSDQVSGQKALRELVGDEIGALLERTVMFPWIARRETPPTLEAKPAPTPAPEQEFATLQAVDLAIPPPPLRYVIPDLELAPGKVSALQGFAYTSKTPFALMEAICVAAGVEFLNMRTVQCPVAYIDFEPSILTQERAVRIMAGLRLRAAEIPLHYFKAAPLSASMLDELRRLHTQLGIGMMVIDTYSSALPEGNNFNDSTFRQWATALGAYSDETDVVVQLLLHDTKGAGENAGIRGISGHGSLAGALQSAVKLTRPNDDDATLVRVSCARATRKGFDAFDVRWSDEPCEGAPDGVALVAKRTEAAPAAKKTTRAAKSDDANERARVRSAGAAIMPKIARGTWTIRSELVRLGGEGVKYGNLALQRLMTAGLLDYRAGSYAPTDKGINATEIEIMTALGGVAGFQR